MIFKCGKENLLFFFEWELAHVCVKYKFFVCLFCFFNPSNVLQGFPGGTNGKGPDCYCRRCKRLGLGPWVREDPLEEGMAIYPSILAWRIPWAEAPDRLQSIGSQKSQARRHTHTHSEYLWIELQERNHKVLGVIKEWCIWLEYNGFIVVVRKKALIQQALEIPEEVWV